MRSLVCLLGPVLVVLLAALPTGAAFNDAWKSFAFWGS